MKLADVEIGKEYAIGQPNSNYDFAYRAEVIEIDKFYKNGRSWRRSDKRKRAKVEAIRKDGSKQEPKIVDAREILMTWDEWAEKREEKKRKKKEAQQRRKDRREKNERLQVELCDKLENMGLEICRIFDLPRVDKFRSMRVDYHGSSEAKMSFEALEELIETVYKAGFEDGQDSQ